MHKVVDIFDQRHLKTLKEKRKELIAMLKRVDKAIYAIEGDIEDEIQWTYRAMECIKGWDEFLPTATILDCMFHDNESALDRPGKRRNYLVALSVALNKLSEKGTLFKFNVKGVRGFFYGLPEWTVDGNSIKPKYMSKLKERLNERSKKSA